MFFLLLLVFLFIIIFLLLLVFLFITLVFCLFFRRFNILEDIFKFFLASLAERLIVKLYCETQKMGAVRWSQELTYDTFC